MAIKNIIARGIGFSPGSVEYVVTHGFGSGAAAAVSYGEPLAWRAFGRRQDWAAFDRETGWVGNRPRQEWGRRI